MNTRKRLWNWAFLASTVFFTTYTENGLSISDEIALSDVVLSVSNEYRGRASLRIQGNITRPLSSFQKLFLIAPLKIDETHATIPVYTFRAPYFEGSKRIPKSVQSRVRDGSMGSDLGSFSVSGKDFFLTVDTSFDDKYRFRIGELGDDKKISLVDGVRLMCRLRSIPEHGTVARKNYILFFDFPRDLKSDTEKTLETIGSLVEALTSRDSDQRTRAEFLRLLLLNLAAEERILAEASLGYMEHSKEFPLEALELVYRLTRVQENFDISEKAVRVLGHYGNRATFTAAPLMEEIWTNRMPDWQGYSNLISLHTWARITKNKIQTIGKIGDESLPPQLDELNNYLENYISKLPKNHNLRQNVEGVLLEISLASQAISERNKK